MESSLKGVPISATQTSPKASPSQNNTLSGIRAPLTVDDSDFEYSFSSSKSRRNSTTSSYYSGSELDSSEDEFITASDNPYVTDPDEKIRQETNFLENYAISRPNLISPDKEIVQESSIRPSARNPDDEIRQETNFLENYAISRPNLISPDEEMVQESSIRPSARNPVSGKVVFRPLVRTLDERIHNGNSNADDDSGEDFKIPVVKKSNVPKARVSGEWDSDEGSHSDEDFRSIVRVPSVEVLQRVNSALKIRMVESDEEDDDNGFGGKNMLEDNFVHMGTKDGEGQGHIGPEDENMVGDNFVVMDTKDEEGHIGPEESAHRVVSAEKGSNFDKEDAVNSLVVNEEYNPISESGHLEKEIQENDEEGKSIDTDLEGKFVLNRDFESEKMENKTEEGMIVESFKEAENVEDSSFHIVTEAVVSENESLIDHTQHVDDQIVIKLDDELDADRQITDSEAKNSNQLVPHSTDDEVEKPLSERDKKQLEKIQHIRVNYLRLLHRLNCSHEDPIASKFLNHLSTAEAKLSPQCFRLDSAIKAAIELEAEKKGDLDFSLCILVIGKTGVGKSATINSLFGEAKTVINAFEPSTTRVEEIMGTINGVKVKVFDTPGFRTSPLEDQSINRRVLSSIKKVMKRTPPDVILYIDRLDTQIDDNLNDLHVVESITSFLGSSVWRKSILVLTHGDLMPRDEVFVAQKLRVFRKLISRSIEEMNFELLILVSVVENRSFAEKNGESWRLELMLLCYSIKTLSEMSSSIITNEKPSFGLKTALSYLLSFLLHPNLDRKIRCDEPIGDSFLSVLDLEEEKGIECNDDNTPPLKLKKTSRVGNLSMGQRRGYFDEYNYSSSLDEDENEIDNATRFSPEITAQLNDEKQELDIKLHSPLPLGLSITRHRGDTYRGDMYGCTLQSRFPVGGNTKVNVGVSMNNRFNGQVSIKTRSYDQRMVGAVGFVVIFRALFGRIFRRSNEDL